MNYFEKLSQKELRDKKDSTLKAAWLLSLFAPLVTAIAFILGRRSVLLADFFRRTSELIALFLAWYVFRLVEKNPDDKYTYGYYKMEDLSSLLMAVIMILSFIIIFYNSIQELLHPSSAGWLIPGLIIAGLGLVVNGFFWQRNYFLNKRENSPLFAAQWRLYRAKTLIDLCVFFTLIFNIILDNRIYSLYIDLIGTTVIAGFLLVSGFYLLKKAFYSLADKSPFDVKKIRSVIKPFPPGMLKINQLRCRQAGNMIIFDITVVVENDINMEKWSGIYRKITKRLKDKYPNSQVNIIPAGPDHIKNNF